MRHQLNTYLLLGASLLFRVNGLGSKGWAARLAFLCGCNFPRSAANNATCAFEPHLLSLDGDELEVIAIKIGGSSLTDKANKETINPEALEWFAKTVFNAIHHGYTNGNEKEADQPAKKPHTKRVYVIVHGAGSFGHHTAKEYGLKGQFTPPPDEELQPQNEKDTYLQNLNRRRIMRGLAETRVSVQSLNRVLVSNLIQQGVNAVAISPCFAIPSLQAHGANAQARAGLATILRDTLQAGLVPVLHGDACLYGRRDAGILSGDILMEEIGQLPWVSHIVFLTDVDGVYTTDPRMDPEAKLLSHIQIHQDTLEIIAPILNLSGSSHGHDVTGGFKTKLDSAAVIAAAGKNVTIAKCGSNSGEQAMRMEEDIAKATTVYSTG